MHHFVVDRVPVSDGLATTLGFYRIAPAVTLFVTFYITVLALTPSRYRKLECRKWPGALLITDLVAADGRAAADRARPVRRL